MTFLSNDRKKLALDRICDELVVCSIVFGGGQSLYRSFDNMVPLTMGNDISCKTVIEQENMWNNFRSRARWNFS